MDIKMPEVPARQLLLHPLNLLHEISSALLPGILGIFILMLKHSSLMAAALAATWMLGYKSRIVLGLLVALVIGRVVQSAALIAVKILSAFTTWLKNKVTSKEGPQLVSHVVSEMKGTAETPGSSELILPASSEAEFVPQNTQQESAPAPLKLTPEQESIRGFFLSLLMGTVLARDGSAFDSWESARSRIALTFGSGCVLLTAACYPGDGLRLQELIGSVLLITAALTQMRGLGQVKIEAIGAAMGQVIAAHTVKENTEILQMASKILPVITKHINPNAEEIKPVVIVTEVADSTQSGTKTRDPNRKARRRR